MGIGGISIWQLLIVLVIVVLLFGTKRIRTLGSDLGGALKGFRGAMRDAEEAGDAARNVVTEEPARLEGGTSGAQSEAASAQSKVSGEEVGASRG